MNQIAIFGGTIEGRKLAEAMAGANVTVHVCVATQYGASLLPSEKNIVIHAARMEQQEMEHFLRENDIELCLDATHPYAAAVTENIRRACAQAGSDYIRVLREETEPAGGGIVYCEDAEEAADYLSHTTGNIFLTTGSKELDKYTVIPDFGQRCYARVLPAPEVLEKCRQLGLQGRHLIAMQGPFSEEMNEVMLRDCKAEWLVTKSSGRAGGYQEKCEAAVRAGVNIVVIARPGEADAKSCSLEQVLELLQERCGLSRGREAWLVGMGPGGEELLTGQACRILEQCDCIIGARRILDIWPGAGRKPCLSSYRREEILTYLRENPGYRRVALVYSGDIGFYSGARGIQESLLQEGFSVHRVAGLSAPLYFLDKLGIPWEDVRLLSLHGQRAQILPFILQGEKVCALLGRPQEVGDICGRLAKLGMEKIRVTVGERLSYPEENITQGTAEQLCGRQFDPLSVVLFENPAPVKKRAVPGVEDEAFIRGGVPMTKQEIRTLSLAKLGLCADSVLYDVGAGTGSVSVEAAMLCPEGTVWAIEQKKEGTALIEENRRKFSLGNLEIVEGTAPEAFFDLPAPTHAFIGGSDGRLLEIIEKLRAKNPQVRFVLNAVTLETIAQIQEIMRAFPAYEENLEIVQVTVAKARRAGRYHLMNGENPVYIVRFGGRS